RRDYDKLKATLYNAVHQGPASQFQNAALANTNLKLQGKIAWVTMVHPERSARLRHLYDQITWPHQA
ncbi:RNA-directed DNA polymerase, partial [bacterium]|nr:RNA-directed DNA polymerase [bacterium]